ncbi:hypothetical protein GCM10009722_27420 [Williamsia deligens]
MRRTARFSTNGAEPEENLKQGIQPTEDRDRDKRFDHSAVGSQPEGAQQHREEGRSRYSDCEQSGTTPRQSTVVQEQRIHDANN